MTRYYLRRMNFEYIRYWNDHEHLRQHNTSNRIPCILSYVFYFYNNNRKRDVMVKQEMF